MQCYLLIIQLFASFLWMFILLRETEWVLPAAKAAGFNGFNRYWYGNRALWINKLVSVLDLASWFPLLVWMMVSNSWNAATALFLLGIAPWVLHRIGAGPSRQRLRLGYHAISFHHYRRAERTTAALWLLKSLVLANLAASLCDLL